MYFSFSTCVTPLSSTSSVETGGVSQTLEWIQITMKHRQNKHPAEIKASSSSGASPQHFSGKPGVFSVRWVSLEQNSSVIQHNHLQPWNSHIFEWEI